MPQVTAASDVSFSCRLRPEPVQVGYAREQVRKVVPGWGLAEYDDLLQLIVSELVTNALAYCDDLIDLLLWYDGSDLWIEVRDNSTEIPVRQDPDDDEESGRGLQLIDGLIDMYRGIRGTAERYSGAGKTVYVALSLCSGQGSLALGSGQCLNCMLSRICTASRKASRAAALSAAARQVSSIRPIVLASSCRSPMWRYWSAASR